jgi:DNA primase
MSQGERIPPEKIDEVRLAADIVEVVGSRIRLDKRGRDFWGLCPFHGDSSPSLKVDREKGTWHCFGCGEGGSVFNFLMRDANLSFPEAVRELAARCGVPLPAPHLDPEAKARETLKERLLQVLQLAGTFFIRQLELPSGRLAREYLTSRRGLAPETLAAFGLGWVPDEWEGLGRFLANQGVAEETAVQAGLVVKRDQGKGCYDRFRGRVIFPIRDTAGRVVSFGGRVLGEGEPKYLNGPESPVFHKSRSLYNLDQARSQMRRKDRALVVEGYFDVITLAAGGFGETVAPLGTALTPQQARALKGQASDLVLVFDGDSAGIKAAARALPVFLGEGLHARVLALPSGDDPDTFLRREGPEALEGALTRARPLTEMVLERAMAQGDRSTPEGRSRLVAACGEVLAAIKDPVTRAGYLEQVASSLRLDPRVVAAQLGLPLTGGERPRAAAAAGRACRVQSNRRTALELALASPEAARVLLEGGALSAGEADPSAPEDEPGLDGVARAMAALVARGVEPTPDAVALELDDQALAPLVARLAQRAPHVEPARARAMALDLLQQMQRGRLCQEQDAIKQAIAAAEAQGDHERLASLQARRKDLSQRLSSLHRAKD